MSPCSSSAEESEVGQTPPQRSGQGSFTYVPPKLRRQDAWRLPDPAICTPPRAKSRPLSAHSTRLLVQQSPFRAHSEPICPPRARSHVAGSDVRAGRSTLHIDLHPKHIHAKPRHKNPPTTPRKGAQRSLNLPGRKAWADLSQRIERRFADRRSAGPRAVSWRAW